MVFSTCVVAFSFFLGGGEGEGRVGLVGEPLHNIKCKMYVSKWLLLISAAHLTRCSARRKCKKKDWKSNKLPPVSKLHPLNCMHLLPTQLTMDPYKKTKKKCLKLCSEKGGVCQFC